MFRRLLPVFWIALISTTPLAAQTILLVVQESLAGTPLPSPLAAKEGLGSGLFDAGYIVFEYPDSDKAPDQAVVMQTARSTGADLVLNVSIAYTETSISTRLVRCAGRATYALIGAANGEVRLKGLQDASNKDREGEIDRRALGKELGTFLARKVAQAIIAAARTP
jgi:hypothetical protein